jgi:hypothetical protein
MQADLGGSVLLTARKCQCTGCNAHTKMRLQQRHESNLSGILSTCLRGSISAARFRVIWHDPHDS